MLDFFFLVFKKASIVCPTICYELLNSIDSCRVAGIACLDDKKTFLQEATTPRQLSAQPATAGFLSDEGAFVRKLR